MLLKYFLYRFKYFKLSLAWRLNGIAYYLNTSTYHMKTYKEFKNQCPWIEAAKKIKHESYYETFNRIHKTKLPFTTKG